MSNAAATAVLTGAASNTAISTINNRGNPGAVVDDVTSEDALRGYAVAGATAGLTTGYFDGWTGTQTGTGNAVQNGVKVVSEGGLSTWGGIGSFAGNQLLQNGTSTLLDRALGGNSQLGETLQSSLANTFAAAGFNFVGDITGPNQLNWAEGSPAKIGLHAVMGGLAAAAAGGDFRTGALAAGVNEALVDTLAKQYAGMDPDQKKSLLVMNSQLIGMLAAAAQRNDADSLQTGAQVAGTATLYNHNLHDDNPVKEVVDEIKEGLHEHGNHLGDPEDDDLVVLDPTPGLGIGYGKSNGAIGGASAKGGTIAGPKVPPKLEAFTNPPQGPVIPAGWVSRPGRTEGSTIYFPAGTDPSKAGSTYIRVMPGGSTPVPGLENGYWISVKNGQPTNPATGGTGTRGETHIPLPPDTVPPKR
ncbi:DUF637 domain-containing protein [Pseudomonas nitroreducens]|uniref:DUF637 domain-containing protein n=1 Tax=Pseudomonas nitroreducens TaxID=46680 RepID=UPI00351D59A0